MGVAGALLPALAEGLLNWQRLRAGLVATCPADCMIGLILAGAAFPTLAMGFLGLPREVAAATGAPIVGKRPPNKSSTLPRWRPGWCPPSE